MIKNPLVLFVIGALLTYFIIKLITCSNTTKEGMCLCGGVGQKICQDSDTVRRLYDENKLTEYTIGN
jgi:hypothetical protein